MHILFAVSTLSLAHGQTGNYHPFPDSNAIWNFHYDAFCFSKERTAEDYSIVMYGDTIINSLHYSKLATPYIKPISAGPCTSQKSGYKGAIRQNINTRSVFYIPPGGSVEYLLYDFSLQIGDTVKGYLSRFWWDADIVKSIDSILVDNSYRKRWTTNEYYGISIIEGIGSTYGLIVPSPGSITDQPSYWITCFRHDDKTLLPNSKANCEEILSLNDLNDQTQIANMYPNPSTGDISIESSIPMNMIIIINSLGSIAATYDIDYLTSFKTQCVSSGLNIVSVFDAQRHLISRQIAICIKEK